MKSFLTISLAILSLFFANPSINSLHASAVDDLNEVIVYADQAKENAKAARTAAKDIAVMYFQLQNTNVGGHINLIINEMDELEEASDEIIYYAQQAANQNPAIDPTNIINWSSQLEGLGDFAINEALNLKTLIESNQRSAARKSYKKLRAYLNQQINLAKLIRLEALALIDIAQTYNVRIELLYNGTVYTGSTTLGGFYAFNTDTQQYYYPSQGGQDNQLLDLPGGNYTFGSYDGYFDGTNTVSLSLDPSLVGTDGFIAVQLNYWSE